MNKDFNIRWEWLKFYIGTPSLQPVGLGWQWLLCLKTFVPCLGGPLKIRSYMVLPGAFGLHLGFY